MSDTSEAFEALLVAARRLAPPGAVSAWELSPTSPHFTLACGQTSPSAPDPLSLTDSPLIGQAVALGLALAPGPDLPADALLTPPGGSALALRLGPAEHPLGLLLVQTSSLHEFTAQEMAALQALCDLGATTLAVARRAADLARAEASRNQFIHVTTHELRSPLAVSQTLIRNVVKGYAGPLTDKQREVFTRISGQLDRLEGLVNDLLDLAASRAIGAEALTPVMLNAAIGRAVLLLAPNAEAKGLELVLRPCREELLVLATEEGLDRIFVNLIGNAIKYTPAGGRVTVSVARHDEQLVVAVADTGLGIPAEAMAHLFEEFYRAPNVRAANITGTGLGLVIVKELVQRFRGQIAVASEEGKGTTFTVRLPRYR